MKDKADIAASVAARLLNRAKQSGDEHQSLLTSYCLERFLYRLGSSDRRDRFKTIAFSCRRLACSMISSTRPEVTWRFLAPASLRVMAATVWGAYSARAASMIVGVGW